MSFIFGEGTPWTQEELTRKREIADQLMRANTQTPQNVGQGIHAIGRALAARNLNRRADARDAELSSEFSDQFSQIFGGAPAGQTVTGGSDQSVMTGSSGPDNLADSTGWLTYANQNATRNLPLSGDLVDAMSFLPEMGITMEVFSGGQEAEGPNRVGSHRHDHGNAADVFFHQNGRRLDWANPEDRPIFEEIVRRSRAAGLTGFGAGDNYMQPGSMHLGYGNEAVWGAGGSGANAPDWLRSAFYSSEPVSGGAGNPVLQGQSAGDQIGGGDYSRAMQIAELMNSPYATPGQRAILGAMLERSMPQQPMSPLEQIQLETAQLQLEQMRNPPQGDRERVQDANGRWRYVDSGELVFPDLEEAAEGPDVDGESALRKEFNSLPAVKAFTEQAQAYGRIVASAQDPSPAGDLALIFNFMKVLDPGSVVRESEFATAEAAAAWMQQYEEGGASVPRPVASAIRRMQTGQRLSPEQRQDFVGRANTIYRQSESQYEDLRGQYQLTADAYDFDRERSIPDMRYNQRGAPMTSLRPNARADQAPQSGGAIPDLSNIQTREDLDAILGQYATVDEMPQELRDAVVQRARELGLLE